MKFLRGGRMALLRTYTTMKGHVGVSKVKPHPGTYDKRQYPILSDKQYERLLGACEHNPFLQLYALVLGETGMRCESEALWLQWEDIDREGGFIKIVSGPWRAPN